MELTIGPSAKYQKYIHSFSACAQNCYACFNACLDEADVAARQKCIKLLIECAKACETTALFMALDGKFIKQQCQLCATVCDVCAQECALFEDEHCRICARECRACAEQCAEMIGKK